ncbi:hypothetical protein D3C86_1355870 [compost metagenome]
MMTGTTRPLGVSAAKPMLKYFFSTRLSPSSEALKFGNFFSAATVALIMKASMVTLTPDFSFSLFSCTRKASRSVISASSQFVTCGIMTQLRCRLAPEIFLMREIGLFSTSPKRVKSTFGHGSRSRPTPEPPAAAAAAGAAVEPLITPLTKPCTSSCVIRPFGPVPGTRDTSTPSSRANLRTDGLAWAALPVTPWAAGAGAEFAGAGAGAAAAAGAGAGAAAAGAGAGAAAGAAAAPAAPAASSTTISVPSATLSPTLILISLTVPACGLGTSMVALSDSSVTSASSALIVSPTFTWMSITGTAS